MCEQPTPDRDRGMTLPELLISIAVIGLVASVLVAGISVTLRQHEDTRGRIDVARWEQNLGMWLPDDLRSASDASAEPNATPCGAPTCGGTPMSAGSNALWLSWNEGGVTTQVSYRYQPDGEGYGLFRVMCVGDTCSTLRVLSDLSSPPAGWAPGQQPPADIIRVGLPVAPADPSVSPAPRSVVVTVNGVPALDGVSRSSKVSVAVGGTPLSTLPPAQFVGPSFVEAASDCGGPISLIVDSSGSIGGQMDAVRLGVEQFIRVLDGTPTRLQIIDFDNRARVLDPLGTGSWNVYLDMSEPANADLLIGSLGTISAGGWTNWEDALNRAFYWSDGVSLAERGNAATPAPKMVVFFTDGLPTRDRLQTRTGQASTLPNPPPAPFTATENAPAPDAFSPRSWWRASEVASEFRGGTRLIGLGVGSAFDRQSSVRDWPEPLYAHEKFLGDVIVGGNVTDSSASSYVKRRWEDAGTWGDVSNADLLVSADFSKFGEALQDIALAECGGTLTVQTRTEAGATAPFNLRYTSGSEQVTTSRIAKSGTFDINLAGEASSTVQLVPSVTDLGASGGFTAQSWACRSRSADLAFTLLDPYDPAAGIELTVRANGAVSCTLTVGK